MTTRIQKTPEFRLKANTFGKKVVTFIASAARRETNTTQEAVELLQGMRSPQRAVMEAISRINAKGLFDLVKDGKTTPSEIEKAIRQGADVNARDSQDRTLLMFAARENRLDLAKVLVKHDADVNLRSDDDLAALNYAINKSHKDFVKFLIKSGADVNASDNPLFIALQNQNNSEIVDELIKGGARVNSRHGDGWTPLMIASHNGNVKVIEVLLSHDAHVNAKSDKGYTPLYLALHNNNVAAKVLIENGASSRGLEEEFLGEKLFRAVDFGNVDFVRTLIKIGANINARNANGQTPLGIVCRQENVYSRRDVQMVKYLLENGADVNIRDNSGNTPLTTISSKKVTYDETREIIELLKQHGAQVENDDGSKKEAVA